VNIIFTFNPPTVSPLLEIVMAGLGPAIHVFASQSPKADVDHRDKPGDDERWVRQKPV
jgi:hypothetical protein